jgi:hypothetical protein
MREAATGRGGGEEEENKNKQGLARERCSFCGGFAGFGVYLTA